jgi:hypothetical protein
MDPATLDEFGVPADALDSLAHTAFWTLPSGPRRTPFPLDVKALLDNREAYDAARAMHDAKGTMRLMREWMRHDAAALREQVEAELDR